MKTKSFRPKSSYLFWTWNMQNEQIATDEFRKRIKEATEAISKSSKDLYRQLEKK